MVAKPNRQQPVKDSFPIVGIGASAGGLEALEQFLGHVPKQSGMAFVIVQHLDPTHKGIMSELLQRATGMRVVQIKDRTPVQPDCVYVIAPNKDISILHGVLHLLAPAAPRGLRLTIDYFFRSLAQDQQEHSVGVILFAPQNLIMDPPFTKLDILSCRNLLIYLTPEVQKKLIPLFHYSLAPGGLLFQGSAETIGDSTALFSPLSGKSRLFRRTESALLVLIVRNCARSHENRVWGVVPVSF